MRHGEDKQPGQSHIASRYQRWELKPGLTLHPLCSLSAVPVSSLPCKPHVAGWIPKEASVERLWAPIFSDVQGEKG